MIANIKMYPQNLWIVIVLLLPNLLLIFFPAINVPAETARPSGWSIVIILERIGQAMVFLLPLFIDMKLESSYKKYLFAFMIFAAMAYYICWGRFFFNNRIFSLMYEKLLFIPIPMALLPVLYFLAAAVLMDSWLYGIGAAVFAVGHLLESWYVYTNII